MGQSVILFITIKKLCFSIFPFLDFLYIAQLEEYDNKRFLHWLPKFFWRRNFQNRQYLVLTQRAKSILVTSIILFIALFAINILLWSNKTIFLSLTSLLIIVLIPCWVLAANMLLSPYFELKRSMLRTEATKILAINKTNVKTIAILGSYGKTTVKNFLFELTKYNYVSQMVPGNINTPTGIAAWMVSKFKPSSELLIVEMDAYYDDEITKSCSIIMPDIVIFTNIGDQHLERFGTKLKLTKALSEAIRYSNKNAIIIATDETFQQLKQLNLPSRQEIVAYNDDTLSYKGQAISCDLSSSNKLNLNLALTAAEHLDIPARFVFHTAQNLSPPDRRQKVTTLFGLEAVDDSYNISFTTACAGLKVARHLADSRGKKLLVITAGIPELSKENSQRNKDWGKCLGGQADSVIVLKSIFHQDILVGLGDKTPWSLYKNLNKAIEDMICNFPIDQWFLLMQPELNDLYY